MGVVHLVSDPVVFAILLMAVVVIRLILALPARPPRRNVRNFDDRDPYTYDDTPARRTRGLFK